MWVHGDLVICILYKDDFGSLDGVGITEAKLQPVGLTLVERVVVQDLDIHKPLLEVISGDEEDAGR